MVELSFNEYGIYYCTFKQVLWGLQQYTAVHIKLPLLASFLRQEQSGVNINSTTSLTLCCVTFFISFEKSSSSSSLVGFAFLAFYLFVQTLHQIPSLPSALQDVLCHRCLKLHAAALQLYASKLPARYCQERKYTFNRPPPWRDSFWFSECFYCYNFNENYSQKIFQILLELAICITNSWEQSTICVKKTKTLQMLEQAKLIPYCVSFHLLPSYYQVSAWTACLAVWCFSMEHLPPALFKLFPNDTLTFEFPGPDLCCPLSSCSCRGEVCEVACEPGSWELGLHLLLQ